MGARRAGVGCGGEERAGEAWMRSSGTEEGREARRGGGANMDMRSRHSAPRLACVRVEPTPGRLQDPQVVVLQSYCIIIISMNCPTSSSTATIVNVNPNMNNLLLAPTQKNIGLLPATIAAKPLPHGSSTVARFASTVVVASSD